MENQNSQSPTKRNAKDILEDFKKQELPKPLFSIVNTMINMNG